MPLIDSNYKTSLIFQNGFISTVYSGLIRKIKIQQQRERICLRDGDFLDLDWSYAKGGSTDLIILLHGMEGNGQRPYVSGVAHYFNSNKIDAVCVNFRSCSGELNRSFSSFHSGQTNDLDDVIQQIISKKKYDSIFLKGVSLGGNIVLKYLGETTNLSPKIKAAMAVSVPIDLAESSRELHRFKNILFHIYFMIGLKLKLKQKHRQFPEKLSKKNLWSIWTLRDVDEHYTAPANGFKNADDYYSKSSSKSFLIDIQTPVLLLNALNDSFLSPSCYPFETAKKSSFLYLETPKYGGHVGFVSPDVIYYNEKRALEFFLKFK